MEKHYRMISRSSSAYAYPLLIKSLLNTPVLYAPDQEIVYGDHARLTYREFRQRVGRLATGLQRLGVGPGDTVAVLDWNSHRYLECFFAVPMMGAVLHTVNVRLSPEQMLETMLHAEDSVVLVYEDFLSGSGKPPQSTPCGRRGSCLWSARRNMGRTPRGIGRPERGL